MVVRPYESGRPRMPAVLKQAKGIKALLRYLLLAPDTEEIRLIIMNNILCEHHYRISGCFVFICGADWANVSFGFEMKRSYFFFFKQRHCCYLLILSYGLATNVWSIDPIVKSESKKI